MSEWQDRAKEAAAAKRRADKEAADRPHPGFKAAGDQFEQDLTEWFAEVGFPNPPADLTINGFTDDTYNVRHNFKATFSYDGHNFKADNTSGHSAGRRRVDIQMEVGELEYGNVQWQWVTSPAELGEALTALETYIAAGGLTPSQVEERRVAMENLHLMEEQRTHELESARAWEMQKEQAEAAYQRRLGKDERARHPVRSWFQRFK